MRCSTVTKKERAFSLPAITLLVNVVIAIYLVIHVWRRTHQHDAATSS